MLPVLSQLYQSIVQLLLPPGKLPINRFGTIVQIGMLLLHLRQLAIHRFLNLFKPFLELFCIPLLQLFPAMLPRLMHSCQSVVQILLPLGKLPINRFGTTLKIGIKLLHLLLLAIYR